MHALLLVIGLLLGSAVAPASLGAITALQWAELGLAVAKGVPQVITADKQLLALLNSQQFRDWVAANAAANGEGAIRMYPGNVN